MRYRTYLQHESCFSIVFVMKSQSNLVRLALIYYLTPRISKECWRAILRHSDLDVSYDNQYEMRRTSASSVDIVPNDYAEPKKIWLSFPLKVGVVLFRKFELGAAYSPNMPLSHRHFLYNYSINTLQAGVVYHF
jgi:hypothetical protein